MRKISSPQIWKKSSPKLRHKEDVLKHINLLKWAKSKYIREHGIKTSANCLIDFLLEKYCEEKNEVKYWWNKETKKYEKIENCGTEQNEQK
jgi:hypothetical protein